MAKRKKKKVNVSVNEQIERISENIESKNDRAKDDRLDDDFEVFELTPIYAYDNADVDELSNGTEILYAAENKSADIEGEEAEYARDSESADAEGEDAEYARDFENANAAEDEAVNMAENVKVSAAKARKKKVALDFTGEAAASEAENPAELIKQSESRTAGFYGKPSGISSFFKYFTVIAVSLIYWEVIMGVQLGGFSSLSFYFLLFIPAQSAILACLCGIGNRISSRITFPVVLALPCAYYIAQSIYLRNFGSLFSISMAGMGNDAVGNFGWAVTDAIESEIPYIILIILPVIAAIVLSITDILKYDSFHVAIHFAALAAAAALWVLGMLGARAFGNDRTSPYYLLTSASATTDSAAKKVGTLTTGIVESASYYLGIRGEDESGFADEEYDYDIESIAEDTTDKTEVKAAASGTQTDEEAEEEPVKKEWVNEAIDFDKISSLETDTELKELADYFAKRKPTTTNDYTGMFEGYNLIYICAESFWSYACNEEVTPTLYKMAHNGIVLNNYYNSFLNTTTNGEFAFDTSLWPDVSRYSKNGTDVGSFAQSSTKFMPQGLGDLFTAEGIPSYAFHNYYGKYYRRILSWPNLGYKCRFTGDNMWFTSNWPASDLELMQQTVDDYINDDQFHAYYMTFSGHGPYTSKNYMYNKNIGEVNSILGTDSMSDMARGYLAGELELDKAMEYLLERLEEAGQLDNTVIVLTGDHYPYYLDDANRDSLVGYQMDSDFEIYKSNCIIYNAAMEGDKAIQVDDYCCNIDIEPTVLNLFNIPYDSRLMIGKDIFSDEAHNRAVLYNMSFITDKVKYNYETGEASWTDEGNKMSEDEKNRYIDSQLNSIENEYKASCKVIDDNFFLEVYKLSGLLAGDELTAELEREEKAKAEDNSFNAEDEAKKAANDAANQTETLTVDPLTGLTIDPATGLPIDPATGLPIDTNAAQTVDPLTGLPADANAAAVTDPNAAAVTDPNAAAVTDPNAAAVTDLNAATVTEPNAAVVTDPNAAAVTDPNALVTN